MLCHKSDSSTVRALHSAREVGNFLYVAVPRNPRLIESLPIADYTFPKCAPQIRTHVINKHVVVKLTVARTQWKQLHIKFIRTTRYSVVKRFDETAFHSSYTNQMPLWSHRHDKEIRLLIVSNCAAYLDKDKCRMMCPGRNKSTDNNA